MQPELQKLPWRRWAALCKRERINRKAGSREGQQGSENAFLLLEDQNQKYFLGSKQDKQTNQSIVANFSYLLAFSFLSLQEIEVKMRNSDAILRKYLFI